MSVPSDSVYGMYIFGRLARAEITDATAEATDAAASGLGLGTRLLRLRVSLMFSSIENLQSVIMFQVHKKTGLLETKIKDPDLNK